MTTPLRRRPTLTAIATAVPGLTVAPTRTASVAVLPLERQAGLTAVPTPRHGLVAVDIADPALSVLLLASPTLVLAPEMA